MNNDYLQHYGIKGMKWGVRRYQNKDGTLTKAGLKRQAARDDELTRLKKSNDRNRSEAEKTKKYIKELDKQGTKHKDVARYRKDVDSDKELSDMLSDKDLLKDLKGQAQKDLRLTNHAIKQNTSRIKNLESSSISQKTYLEDTKNASRIANGKYIAGTMASVGISSLAYSKGIISGKTAVNTALAGSLGSMIIGTAGYAKSADKIKDRYNIT